MAAIASSATAVLIAHVAAGRRAHPRRRRRHHAAQPRAARDRRAVRHARRCIPGASTSASAVRRAPTAHGGAAPHAAARRTFPQDVERLLVYLEPAAGPAVRAIPGRVRCRCGSWGRACLARNWPRRSGCRMRSRRTSRRTTCLRRSTSTGASFSPPTPSIWSALRHCDAQQRRRRRQRRRGCSPFTSLQQQFVRLRRGTPGKLPPTIDSGRRALVK